MSPTSRSLALLRRENYLPAIVEKTLPKGFIKVDLWHAWDILAISPEGRVAAVQTTSTSNLSARLEKLSGLEVLRWCHKAGWSCELHGWAKRGPVGKRKLWTCRRLVWDGDSFRPMVES